MKIIPSEEIRQTAMDKIAKPQIKDETIKAVVNRLVADTKSDEEKIERIYLFVRDEIEFGWVYPQEIPADEVLKNRKGVCMQKANLLVAMAREAGFKARFNFIYVHKNALEDFLPKFAYKKWADPFPHTYPEIFLNGKWISMEATFDRKLHEICLQKKLNFGKYENIAKEVVIDFSIIGVKGHQQYWYTIGVDFFNGENLSELTEFMHNKVPFWKKLLLPVIFKKAQKIMDELRNETRFIS
jgi:hypothetical protein